MIKEFGADRAFWNGNNGRGLILTMRSFCCHSWEFDSALFISPSEFDDGMLVFGLMKVTISRWRLNSLLVSKILLTRFVWVDGLANEMVFNDEKLTKSSCILLVHLTINWNILFGFWLAACKGSQQEAKGTECCCLCHHLEGTACFVWWSNGTFTVRVGTQHVILELKVKPSNVEMRTWADVKLLLMQANWIECNAWNKSTVVFQREWIQQ